MLRSATKMTTLLLFNRTVMRIVFLDADTTQKGDLDWSLFSSIGEVTHYALTNPDEVTSRIQDADIVVTNKVKLGREHFELSPRLQMVAVLATGYDIIDIQAAKDHKVTICNIPSYSTASVAQTTFALLLELTHAVRKHSDAVHEGDWTSSPTFSFWRQPLIELSGKRFVVVGYGNIGKEVARIAEAFGMHVVVSSLRNTDRSAPYPFFPIQEALQMADVVSLHCPLTESTTRCVDELWLQNMKPNAYLINTSRGGLIDEHAMASALLRGDIAGYAADVLSVEPPLEDHPLLGMPRCILTPHFAWASLASRERLWKTCAENIQAFIEGTPKNVV